MRYDVVDAFSMEDLQYILESERMRILAIVIPPYNIISP